MGLDMFAYVVESENVVSDSEFKSAKEFFYWRKHHDLHGWMHELYQDRGGAQEFNCVPVRLYEEDLDALERDITKNVLPQTTGFFFGDNPPDEESMENDLKFIQQARLHIANGDAVYYDSWW